MKRTNANADRGNGNATWNACKAFCRKIKAQITSVKEAIFAESSRAFPAPERLVRLALNEAEAAAFQTEYPHLVFPALAAEKVRAVAAWNVRQQVVRRGSPAVALAA